MACEKRHHVISSLHIQPLLFLTIYLLSVSGEKKLMLNLPEKNGFLYLAVLALPVSSTALTETYFQNILYSIHSVAAGCQD